MGISLRKSIDRKCKDCIYDPLSGMGTWREQVEACTIDSCPLWDVRPKSLGARKTASFSTEESVDVRG